jgi:hypothetical protein
VRKRAERAIDALERLVRSRTATSIVAAQLRDEIESTQDGSGGAGP